jgi:hypothetical protein
MRSQQSLCSSLRSLFALPGDLLPMIFSFLSPKELCCLDSAVLNHTDRPIFLSALIQSFQTGKSDFELNGSGKKKKVYSCFCKVYSRWYLCRRIPIKKLVIEEFSCPKGMISMNSTSLQFINLSNPPVLDPEDLFAIHQCTNLKHFYFHGVSFPADFDIASIYQNLTCLETLELGDIPFSRSATEAICRCRSLKLLELSFLKDFGDDDLRLLIEDLPSSIHLLKLNSLGITDESLRMLISRHPRLPAIAIRDDDEDATLSWDAFFSYLQVFTIPQVFNDENPESQFCSMVTLRDTASFNSPFSDDQISALFEIDNLLMRLVELLSTHYREKLGFFIVQFFALAAEHGYHRVLADIGALSAVVCFSLEGEYIGQSLQFLKSFLVHNDCHFQLLTSGVLSLYRHKVSHLNHSSSPRLMFQLS